MNDMRPIPTSELERIAWIYLCEHRWSWNQDEEGFEHPTEAGVFTLWGAAKMQALRERRGRGPEPW